MRRDAIVVATHDLASGTGDEPWCRLARDSEAGLLLPWAVRASVSGAGCFILVIDQFMHGIEVEEPLGPRITIKDLPARRLERDRHDRY